MSINSQVLMISLLATAVLLGILGVFLLQRDSWTSLIEMTMNYATEIVHNIGYVGILVTMALESALALIPSEVVILSPAFLPRVVSWTYS